MKPRSAILFIGAILFSLALLSGASAQEPTPTPGPTFPPPTPVPTEEGGQIFGLTVASTPEPPDPDCSDGRCVFWVSSGSDDAGLVPPYPPVGSCNYSTIDREVYFGECPDGEGIVSGFRFPNVTVPQGAQIAEAYLEFTVDGPYTDELTVAFYGEDSGNAQPFSVFSRPEDRPLTEASVTWHIPFDDRWELGQIRTSPDLTSIVQEIVNRPDWVAGNALAIVVKNAGPASGQWRHRRVIGYERPVWYPGPENAARLIIRLRKTVSVEILDAQGNPVTAQSLNGDGWPVPNPLQVQVTLECTDPAGCDFYPFRLNLGSQDNQGRFYVFMNPLSDGVCTTTPTGSENSQQAIEVFCHRLSLMYRESATYTWQVWIQPSEDTEIIAEASYGPVATDTDVIEVPQASIHPVVVIPGIMGSGRNDQGEWVIDPIFGTYDALIDELEKVGYEADRSLFTFAYDWRQSNTQSGRQLGVAIQGFLNQAGALPYVREDKVDIVAHSMGGLVSRAYIQGSQYMDNVRRLITLGTPHLGAPEAYLAAEGLEIEEGVLGEIMRRILNHMAQKKGYCPAWWSCPDAAVYQYVQEHMPSVQEILPDPQRYTASGRGAYLISAEDETTPYPWGTPPNPFLDNLNAGVSLLVDRLGGSNVISIVGVQQDGNDNPTYTAPFNKG